MVRDRSECTDVLTMKPVIIPYNSMLAILDRALRNAGLAPSYCQQEFEDIETGEQETGILLTHVEQPHPMHIFPKKHLPKVGVLGFVNGAEPGKGTVPLHTIVPEENDILALAYVIEGLYKGDFSTTLMKGEQIPGLRVLLQSYKVIKEDLQKKTYTLLIK